MGQSLHQGRHSLTRSDKQSVSSSPAALLLPAAIPAVPPGGGERTPGALHLDKASQGRLHRQLLGIGGVYAGDQRLHQALEGLASQPPRGKRSQGFVLGIESGRDERLGQQTELSPPAQKRRAQQRPYPRRDHDGKALGHGNQPSLMDHVGSAPVRVGAHQLHSQAAAQLKGPRRSGNEHIGSAFHAVAAFPLSVQCSAGSGSAFPHRQPSPRAQLMQEVGRGQSGDSPAYHSDVGDRSIWFPHRGLPQRR